MEWLSGHHWTDRWGAILTALVGIVGVVGAVTSTVVTQRHQTRNLRIELADANTRNRQERSDQAHAEVREVIAELMAAKSPWDAAISTLFDLALSNNRSTEAEATDQFWQEVESAFTQIGKESRPISLLCSRIGYLTRDEALLGPTDALAKSMGSGLTKLVSQSRHPSKRASGLDFARASDFMVQVEVEFWKVDKAARERLAVSPADDDTVPQVHAADRR